MNYGGQDQRYNGQSLTDGYGDYEGEKNNYYGQQGPGGQQQHLPSFPFSSLRSSQQQQQQQQPSSHPYHGGLHQPSPSGLLNERLPPMSSVARGPSSMQSNGSELGVSALSAAAAAHQMSRLGEAFKDSLAHQLGPSNKNVSGMGPSPYGVSLPQQQYSMGSTNGGHSDRLYGGSANPFPSGMGGGLSEKSSPRSSTQRGSSDNGYGLPTSTRGSADRGIQLPSPSMAPQLGNGAAHQAAVSLSHIAGGGGSSTGSQIHQSPAAPQQQQQAPTTGRTAASMNPKDLLELYSKWDQIDTKNKRNKNEEAQAEEVRKERHNMAEKRRRSDMNGAIDRLKTLLPQQVTNDRRLTKVEVLTEAADHLTQVQNLCAKLITENKRLKLLVPGVKLEDDDSFLTRDDEPAEDGYNSERRSDDGGEIEGEENPAKRQRRNSPGDNSDSNGSGREGEGEGERAAKDYNRGHSSGGSQSGSGEDERDEIVIDPRGDADDDDTEGRDSDNSNDGLTGKQRMAGVSSEGSAGEPTSFSGLSFSQSSQDMAQPQHQQQQQQQHHHQFQHHHGASGMQHHQQLHLHHQHGGM